MNDWYKSTYKQSIKDALKYYRTQKEVWRAVEMYKMERKKIGRIRDHISKNNDYKLQAHSMRLKYHIAMARAF